VSNLNLFSSRTKKKSIKLTTIIIDVKAKGNQLQIILISTMIIIIIFLLLPQVPFSKAADFLLFLLFHG